MKKRAVFMLLAGTLTAGQVMTVSAADSDDRTDKIDKSETVYVKANANGSTTEIKVNELLDISGIEGAVEDYSILKNIKNKEGDEEYTEKSDGSIVWENHGENISYEGTSDKELPVSVKVTYYLDDKKMRPEDMAGKSGRVKIRFDYENMTSETVEVDGEIVGVKVPFMVLSALMLPSDTFSNIQVSSGKVMADKSNNIVAGVAFPGLSESLNLEVYEGTEDIDIPDYVEVTADAENFELEYTATVITTSGLGDMDTDRLEDIDDLSDSMDDLTDASKTLADGMSEMASGLTIFESYLTEYNDGVETLSKGTKALADRLKELDARKTDLTEGTVKLQQALELLNTSIAELQIPDSMSDAVAAAAKLQQDTAVLDGQLKDIAEKLEAADTSLEAAKVSLDAAVAQANQDAENQAETKANVAATEQMRAEVQRTLDAMIVSGELTEEQKTTIINSLGSLNIDIDGIDISSDFDGAGQNVENAGEKLSRASEAAGEVTVSSITGTVEDMQSQVKILQEASGSIASLGTGLEQFAQVLDAAAEGSTQLVKGIDAYGLGVSQVYQGSRLMRKESKNWLTLWEMI